MSVKNMEPALQQPATADPLAPLGLARYHLGPSLTRILPAPIVNALRGLKGRIITRHLPRNAKFEQSAEDALASASMSIIVPVHDAPEMTRRCLASLQKYAPQAEVILVDDASKLAETLSVIQEFAGRNNWKVIRHEKAVGHSGSCKDGADLSTRPYLCLLNSDTVVTPWCWQRVKTVFEADDRIGVAGPSTSFAGTPQHINLAAQLSPHMNDNQICAFAAGLLKEQQPAILDLEWISGFAFFIKRDLWEKLAGFDDKLPDYGNDVELCHRITKMGYRMVWVRDAYIHHFGQQSYSKIMGEEGIISRMRYVLEQKMTGDASCNDN